MKNPTRCHKGLGDMALHLKQRSKNWMRCCKEPSSMALYANKKCSKDWTRCHKELGSMALYSDQRLGNHRQSTKTWPWPERNLAIVELS